MNEMTLTVPDLLSGGEGLTSAVRVAITLTILSLAPAMLIAVTSFTRTIVVLSFLRHGLGLPQTPPTQVLVGLSLFLTAFTMAPVATRMKAEGLDPWAAGTISREEGFVRTAQPLREFMLVRTRERDLALFTRPAANVTDVPLTSLVPAYLVSELTTAFGMGFLLLLPFLAIDLAVASGLMSMGMMVLPPQTVSLPLKLLVFVLADGWNLLAGSLLQNGGAG